MVLSLVLFKIITITKRQYSLTVCMYNEICVLRPLLRPGKIGRCSEVVVIRSVSQSNSKNLNLKTDGKVKLFGLDLEWLLLTGGRCSVLVFNTGLTVLLYVRTQGPAITFTTGGWFYYAGTEIEYWSSILNLTFSWNWDLLSTNIMSHELGVKTLTRPPLTKLMGASSLIPVTEVHTLPRVSMLKKRMSFKAHIPPVWPP